MTSVVDKIISRAMEDGEFDNLPGEGRPLAGDENPHEDPAQRAAYRLLQEHGFTLPWIEMGRHIDSALTEANTRLQKRREWYVRQGLPLDRSAGWERVIQEFRTTIDEINHKIDQHNLAVPLARFQRPRIAADAAIGRLSS